MSENPPPPMSPVTPTPTSAPNHPVVMRPYLRGKGQVILWTAVIFVCGAASGWGMEHLRLYHSGLGMNGGDLPVDLIVQSMTAELLLSPEQVVKVEQEYRERAKALNEIRGSMVPRFRAEYDKLEADLKVILTAEQYKRWAIRFNAARDRMMPPPPGGPGGPGGPGFGDGPGFDHGPGHGHGHDHGPMGGPDDGMGPGPPPDRP